MEIKDLIEGKDVKDLKLNIIHRNEIFEKDGKKMLKLNCDDVSDEIILVLWNDDMPIESKLKEGSEITIVSGGFCKRYKKDEFDEKQVVFGRYSKINIDGKKYAKEENKWKEYLGLQ